MLVQLQLHHDLFTMQLCQLPGFGACGGLGDRRSSPCRRLCSGGFGSRVCGLRRSQCFVACRFGRSDAGLRVIQLFFQVFDVSLQDIDGRLGTLQFIQRRRVLGLQLGVLALQRDVLTLTDIKLFAPHGIDLGQ